MRSGIVAVTLLLGQWIPVVGGPIFAVLIGMLLAFRIREEEALQAGIIFTSKRILQYAVILLGSSLNLSVVAKTGQQPLPITLATITTSLVAAYGLKCRLHMSVNTSTLVGAGPPIYGGSMIAATTPITVADDEEVAQAISVISLFNILAAVLFPWLGTLLHFHGNEGFDVSAGTAVNDTSSVTATAVTWDSMLHSGSATLDKAVAVELTRTPVTISIALFLGVQRMRKEEQEEKREGEKFAWRQVFPIFTLYLPMASAITTVSVNVLHIPPGIFLLLKRLNKFFIIMAMRAIDLYTDIAKLIEDGGKPISMKFCC